MDAELYEYLLLAHERALESNTAMNKKSMEVYDVELKSPSSAAWRDSNLERIEGLRRSIEDQNIKVASVRRKLAYYAGLKKKYTRAISFLLGNSVTPDPPEPD